MILRKTDCFQRGLKPPDSRAICPNCGDDAVAIVSIKAAISGTVAHITRAGLSTSTQPFRGQAVAVRLACECGHHFDFSMRTRCGRTEVKRG